MTRLPAAVIGPQIASWAYLADRETQKGPGLDSTRSEMESLVLRIQDEICAVRFPRAARDAANRCMGR